MERSKARKGQKQKRRILEGKQPDGDKAEGKFREGPKEFKNEFRGSGLSTPRQTLARNSSVKVGRTKPVYHTAVAGLVAEAIMG